MPPCAAQAHAPPTCSASSTQLLEEWLGDVSPKLKTPLGSRGRSEGVGTEEASTTIVVKDIIAVGYL